MTCIDPVYIRDPDNKRIWMRVKCGGCRTCLLARARDMSLRGSHELRYHDEACFLTLTYDDFYLPVNRGNIPSLCPPHLQLFLKRLRKAVYPVIIKYIACGEYGSITARPHYHLIIYGCDFRSSDLTFDSDPNIVTSIHDPNSLSTSSNAYCSTLLSSLWTYGKHHISSVTPASISYVCQYSLKKVRGKLAKKLSYELGQYPEFIRVSRGIGSRWCDEFSSDFSKSDEIIMDNKKYKTPRYYLLRLKKKNPELFEKLVEARTEHIKKMKKSDALRALKFARLKPGPSERGL